MFKQMSSFFDGIFSKYQYLFRKGFSTQQCLLALLEKRKRSIDRGQVLGALLTDLSKAFDCLNHDLLIAKLNAYGFSLPALKVHKWGFENLPICCNSYKNNIFKAFLS